MSGVVNYDKEHEMDIYCGRASPLKINKILLEEQRRQISVPANDTPQDIAFIYEPNEEVFSFNLFCEKRDLASIKNPAIFKNYTSQKNIHIVGVKRGGGMMWHGPGQIILAPLINTNQYAFGIPEYGKLLEEICIQTLLAFGIEGIRNAFQNGARGVWAVDQNDDKKKKIAFFGFSVSRKIIIHGCALNISPDLYPFSLIDPCNLSGVEAISMAKLLNYSPNMKKVSNELSKNFTNELEKYAKKK